MNNQVINQPQGSTYDVGMTNSQSFELAQRAGKLLASCSLVPREYQNNIANCVVALNMAHRMGADPLMVMQNLVIIHGRPTWSSQFLIATFNACGRFSAIRYEFVGTEGQDDWGCYAYATELDTGEVIKSSKITIDLAKKEGWYGKKGSKWQTMPEQMLMYRSASWLVRAYAPELAMGLHTKEEVADFVDVTPNDVTPVNTSSQSLNDNIINAIKSQAPVEDEKEPSQPVQQALHQSNKQSVPVEQVPQSAPVQQVEQVQQQAQFEQAPVQQPQATRFGSVE